MKADLVVARMSDEALWERLETELMRIRSECAQWNGLMMPAACALRAQAIASELRMRGTQHELFRP